MPRSYKFFALFLIISALAMMTYAQGADDTQGAQDEGPQGEVDPTQFYDPEFIKQQQEIQRGKLWGCYFLARNKLFSKADDIGKLFTGNKGESLFRRMATDIMKRCLERVQPEESQKILSSLNEQGFNIDDWNHIHGFDIENYKSENVKLDLDADEKFIYEYYQKIDESVKSHFEEQADKEETAKRRQKLDYEPHIGGISLKETSPFVKSLYTITVVGSILVLFFFAYKKLFANHETPYEKIKRERLEKKRGKSQ